MPNPTCGPRDVKLWQNIFLELQEFYHSQAEQRDKLGTFRHFLLSSLLLLCAHAAIDSSVSCNLCQLTKGICRRSLFPIQSMIKLLQIVKTQIQPTTQLN
jgi:hypothetical protein